MNYAISKYSLVALIIVISLFLSLQACSPQKKQESCNFLQNVYGERISWKENLPVKLYLHSSFPVEYTPALTSAIKRWEEVVGRKLFVLASGYVNGDIETKQDSFNVIYWSKTWDIDRSSDQARTTVYTLGNEIKESDIKINAFDYKFTLDINLEKGVHLESVIMHELGHVLGLKHSDASGVSVMGTYLRSNQERLEIPSEDKESLLCEYQ